MLSKLITEIEHFRVKSQRQFGEDYIGKCLMLNDPDYGELIVFTKKGWFTFLNQKLLLIHQPYLNEEQKQIWAALIPQILTTNKLLDHEVLNAIDKGFCIRSSFINNLLYEYVLKEAKSYLDKIDISVKA